MLVHCHDATSNSRISKVLIFFNEYPLETSSKHYSNTLNLLFDIEEGITCT